MTSTARGSWQKQETRAVRPFRSASEYLQAVEFRLYADSEFRGTDLLQPEPVDVERLSLEFRMPALPSDLPTLVDIPIRMLKVVLTVEDRLMKDARVVYSAPALQFAAPTQVSVSPDQLEGLSWAGDTMLHAAVVLDQSRSGGVGTATRVGSWLARKTFKIGRTRDTSTFPIEPVDPGYFTARGLPPNTAFLVEILDPDFNQKVESLGSMLKVSLARTVHAALAKDDRSATSKALTKAVYVDVVSSVIAAGVVAAQRSVDKGTMLDSLIERVSAGAGVSRKAIEKVAADPGSTHLRSIVQASCDFDRDLIAAVQRKAS